MLDIPFGYEKNTMIRFPVKKNHAACDLDHSMKIPRMCHGLILQVVLVKPVTRLDIIGYPLGLSENRLPLNPLVNQYLFYHFPYEK